MKKYMYLCLAALSIGIFASCKAKKGVEATFSDLDGSWMQSDDGADRIQRFPQEYH